MNENKADGIWYYLPILPDIKAIEFDPYLGDPNKNFLAAPYKSKWSGFFKGDSKDYGLAIAHGPSPMIFIDAVSFETVTVGSASGTLHLDVLGFRSGIDEEFEGTWVITGGSGDLENLRGHGAFWGPGWLGNPEEYGIVYYSVEEAEGLDL